MFTEYCYGLIKEKAHQLTGIELGDHKHYLIDQRIKPLLTTFNISDSDELYARLDTDDDIRKSFVHAITTHETKFFRDEHPFTTFESLYSSISQK